MIWSSSETNFQYEFNGDDYIMWRLHSRVATAITDVFRKNAISVGREFAKMLKILDKIDGIESRRVI